jgi:pSer/pThr/pTyr-binding forkhead associated (FHA) protein/tetratricopeptide (TPR) repeat protein
MAAILSFDRAGERQQCTIETDEFSLGRDSSCDLCLDAGSVSRRHATIRKEDDRYTITDSSTNGTIVDGVLVQKGESRTLDDGSVIVIGDTTLNFKAEAGEGDEGRTMLLPTKKPPRVVLFEGGKPSQEFPLEADEFRIGSDAENDIVLTGTYVSRKHARIVRAEDTFTIIDSSSNGTFVNGERITEHELEDGDSIKIVDHELQFLISEAPGRASPAGDDADKKKKVRIAVLAGASVVLVVLIVVMISLPSSKKTTTTSDSGTAPLETASFNAVLDEADTLVAQERWEEALAKLEAIQTTSPAYLAAQRKMQAIRSEIKCVEAKPEILRLIGEEKFAEAGNLLQGMPASSRCAESVRLEYEAKRADFCNNNLTLAREQLELEAPEEATAFVDKCLSAMPDNQEALQIAKLIEEKTGSAASTEPEPETATDTAAVSAEIEKNREVARATYDRAIRAYLQGDVSSAISNLKNIASLGLPSGDAMKVRAARELEILRDAKRRYDAGTSYYENGDTTKAYGEWTAFLAYNGKLDSGRKGTLYRDVADKMTATYCRFATQKYNNKDYADAFEWWWKAKEVDPDNAAAKEGLTALEKMAIKEYREGYMLAARGSEEAAAKNFRNVLQLVPENHEYYLKAQKKLVEIGQ